MLLFRVSHSAVRVSLNGGSAVSVSVRGSVSVSGSAVSVSVSDTAGPTSVASSAAPRLCPEQGGQDKGEEGKQAGDHVDHQRLLRQLRCVREGGGGRQGRPN